MIVVTTGAPGAGKTLFTIAHVRDRSIAENRQVYFSGIKGLKLPWTEFDDPEDWWKIARDNSGSIIVLDEAQRAFRPRSYGSNVPMHVSELETHRHKGCDLYLITQSPMLLDTNVRRLVGHHRHIVRAFGTAKVTLHEWHNGGVREQCEKPGQREDSVKTLMAYPKDVFSLYESAEVHTHKRTIPMRVWGLLIAPILVGLAGWGTVSYMKGMSEPKHKTVDEPTVTGIKTSTPSSPTASVQALTPQQWLDSYSPRIASLPHTAPRYDSLTVATATPLPVVCVAASTRCTCYSQQGTKMGSVAENLCRTIAADGYFQDFDPLGRPPAPVAQAPTVPLISKPLPEQSKSFLDHASLAPVGGAGDGPRQDMGIARSYPPKSPLK
jgi:zona occludens toxin